MCPSLIEIGSKTAEKNSAQTNKQTNRHYENNGHLAVNQKIDTTGQNIMTCPIPYGGHNNHNAIFLLTYKLHAQLHIMMKQINKGKSEWAT